MYLCLLMLYSVDMFIPFYTGKIIDILGQHYQATEFLSAVLLMAMYSIGRYEGRECSLSTLLHQHLCHLKAHSDYHFFLCN